MPAEGRENPLLKKGNSDAFFREKYLTKNSKRNVTYDSGCKLHKQAPETGLKGLKAVPLDIRLC